MHDQLRPGTTRAFQTATVSNWSPTAALHPAKGHPRRQTGLLLSLSDRGQLAALASGAITSGLGYSLWYFVLPQIRSTTAAVAQLTVPTIAMAGGAIILAEPLTLRLLIAALLVLGGIAFSLQQKAKRGVSKT